MVAYPLASSQPSNCRNPEMCLEKMKATQQKMKQKYPVLLADYEDLLIERCFYVTEHADQRMQERGISLRALYEVLESYEPVEWADVQHRQREIDELARRKFCIQPYRILVAGESELYDQRPLGVVCSYGERPSQGKWELRILTVYELDLSKWSMDLSKRHCFCSEHEEGQPYVEQMIAQHYKGVQGSRYPAVYSAI